MNHFDISNREFYRVTSEGVFYTDTASAFTSDITGNAGMSMGGGRDGANAVFGEFYTHTQHDDTHGYSELTAPEAAAEYGLAESSHGLVMASARMRDLTAEYNQYLDAVQRAWADRERAKRNQGTKSVEGRRKAAKRRRIALRKARTAKQ